MKMKTFLFLFLLLAAGMAAPAQASELEDTMRAWCSQSGTWRGSIDVMDASGQAQQFELVSRHRCTPDGQFHIVEEDFISPDRTDHTAKVTFADPSIPGFHTIYFARGKSSPYTFRFDSVEIPDDENWTQSIISTGEGELFEGRRATLRYTRTRNGNRLESIKEVRFLDTESEFETRSRIVQELAQP